MGLINLRGDIIAVADLTKFLRLQKSSTPVQQELLRIIISKTSGKTCGFLVDYVSQIETLSSDEIEPAPLSFSHEISDYISGISVKNKLPVSILNINKIFSSEEFKKYE